MRTTVTVDDTTVKKLLVLTKTKSLTNALRHIIATFLEQKEKEKLLALFGTVELETDIKADRLGWNKINEKSSRR